MANDITAATALIQDSIESLKPLTAPLSIFTQNYSSEVKGTDETILVPVITDGDATERKTTDAVDYFAEANGSTKTVKIELKSIRRSIAFTEREAALLSDAGLAKHGTELIKSVMVQARRKALSALAATTKTVNVKTADALVYQDFVNLKLECSKSRIPAIESALFQSPEAVAKTLLIEEFSKMYGLSLAQAQNGAISSILGFASYEVDSISEDTFAIAAHNSALALAARASSVPTADWEQTLLTPDGMPVTLRMVSNASKAQRVLVAEVLFGATLIEDRAVKLLTTTA